MGKKDKKKMQRHHPKTLGTFITQPISQPDVRQEETGVAMPNEQNVVRNKNWVDANGRS